MILLITIIHILVCIFLVGIVLLQHGKGADIGATFGGSGQSLFGTEGPVPLMNKVTTAGAILFMSTSIFLAYNSAHRTSGSLMENAAPAPVQQTRPAPQPVQQNIPMPAQKTETSSEEMPVQGNAPATQPAKQATAEEQAPQAATQSAPAAPASSTSPPASKTDPAKQTPTTK